MPVDERRRRVVGGRPDAHPHRRRAAAPRRRLAVAPRKPLAVACTRSFTTITAAGAIAFARPAVGPGAGPGPRARSPRSARPSASTASRCSPPSRSRAAVILGALLLDGWLRREGMEGAEPYVLMLLSASGGVMMASANDLIVMFLGLEILSIAVYVLAAMHLRKITSQEAGVKYFVLGAFSSAFFLYGIALTYGGTGSTNLVDISAFLATTVLADTGLRAGRAGPAPRGLRLQGRRRAVPLLDARRVPGRAQPERGVDGLRREGRRASPACCGSSTSPSAPTGSTGSRSCSSSPPSRWSSARCWPIVQTDVKRMLAYSSINHAGFILVAVQAASERGRRRRRSSTWPPTPSWWRAASASSPS